VAGMKVDYYGWALVLGVGWQGWKHCILYYSLEWLSLYCTILVVSAMGLVCLDFLCRYASL